MKYLLEVANFKQSCFLTNGTLKTAGDSGNLAQQKHYS